MPAVGKLMSKINMSLDDMDLIELNEAFAAQVLSVLREWKLKDEDKLNVNGSGVSLGHPIAATGARILTTLLYEMRAGMPSSVWRPCASAAVRVSPLFLSAVSREYLAPTLLGLKSIAKVGWSQSPLGAISLSPPF